MALTYRDFLSEDKGRAGVLYFGGARMALLDIEAGFWGLRRQVEALVGRRLTDAVLQQAGANGGASFARAFAPDAPPDTAAQALRDCIASYQAAGFGQFEIEVLEWPFGCKRSGAQDRPIGRVLIRGAGTFEAWMMRQHGQKVESPACAYTAGVLVGFVNVLAGRHDVVCIERTCQAHGAESCLFELLPADVAGDVPVVAMAPDPALGRQLNLLEMLFDRMPMGIAIFDRDYRLRRYNPTWASFADRYASPSARPVAPGVDYFEILPGAGPIVLPLFERVLAGETVRQEAVRLEVEGIVSYWDVVLAPLIENGTVTGILNVCTDATNHVQAKEALKESESKFRLLFEESADAMLLLDGDVFVDCNQAAVEMMRCSSKDQLLSLNPHDISPEKQPDGRLSSEKATGLMATAFEDGSLRFEWVHRTADGTDLPVEVLLTAILLHGRPVLHVVWRDITERVRAEEALQSTYQTLEQRVEERTREIERRRQVAEGLRDILARLNSNLALGEVLDFIVDQASRLLDTSVVALYLLEGKNDLLTIQASRGLSLEYVESIKVTVGEGTIGRVVKERRPMVIPDVRKITIPVDEDDRSMSDSDVVVRSEQLDLLAKLASEFVAVLAVPLIAKDEIYGGLALYYPTPREFTDEEINLATAFADHAALAIENARLRIQEEQAAVMKERNRLARELHDSVSQALYGIGLGARTARTLLDRQPVDEETKARLANPLDYVLSLADAGLADMRALIFELRLDALEKEGLVAALSKHAEALHARHKLDVHTEFYEEPELPLETKEALYRIAQEALNNVVKHAHASQVEIRLGDREGAIALEVWDDGIGFDPQDEYAGHLGLQSMQERATRLGGTLEIESAPGHGALLRARIPPTRTA